MQFKSGSSSVGRASASQAEGREFESHLPLKKKRSTDVLRFFVFKGLAFLFITFEINDLGFCNPWFFLLSLITEKDLELAVAQTDMHREIIEQCKLGDSAAQYRLYKLYAKAMFNVARRLMNNREEAEDMLQDSFSDAFARLHSFKFDSGFGSWIKRIVINNCINEIKRRKADLQFFDDMSLFDDNLEENEEDYQSGLSVENIRIAMNELPNGSKVIFSLYLLEGYDHREIAQILNVSESNSKSQYMRARRKIKEILKDKYNETR